jgi:hypothetical protein
MVQDAGMQHAAQERLFRDGGRRLLVILCQTGSSAEICD